MHLLRAVLWSYDFLVHPVIQAMKERMIRVMEVEPRDGYRIWLRYSDGASGEVDLSDLVGKGVFRAWEDRAFFSGVHVSPHGSIAWSDDIEICPDAPHAELAGDTEKAVAAGIPWPR